jgi:hypothetical protein
MPDKAAIVSGFRLREERGWIMAQPQCGDKVKACERV